MRLAKIIPARWFSLVALAAAATPAVTPPPSGLAPLVRTYREMPSPARRAAVEAYAAAHTGEPSGSLARLALGVGDYEQKNYPAAIADLKPLGAKLPQIADYVAYYLAAARVESNDMAGVGADLAPAHRTGTLSPFAGRAWLLEARALQPAEAAQAVRVLRDHYSELPQPVGDVTLADSYLAAGDLPRAADFYQRVYYEYVSGDAASRAAEGLAMLKDTMGAAYPPPLPQQMLRRASRLLDAREYRDARNEYQDLLNQLTGADRDLARVRIGAADYLSGNTAAAYPYLRGLDLPASEADAERLYYVMECARRAMDDDAMLGTVQKLGQQYRQSPWRLKALVSAGNRFLLDNRPDDYIPLYKAVYQDFPLDPAAMTAHWKAAFQAYLAGQQDADNLIREHLIQYPGHATAPAALYFLARNAETASDNASARAFYVKLDATFPNTYYGMLARARLQVPELHKPQAAPEAEQFLAKLSLPQSKPVAVEPINATTVRIERSRLLRTAGLNDLADAELRFGARNGGQPVLLAMEIAHTADASYQGLRAMKSLSGDYLNLPFSGAPRQFWELLFPLPYRADLVASARAQELDPYLLAGLIRQESEFNPDALSRKNAVGLTQVEPATGRIYARRAGITRYTNRSLYRPATNLRIGATIFQSMLGQHAGNLEQTLAAYNAGPNRAAAWIMWRTYREPAEFVESIPYTETRDYVQAVLRNADIYRRLYK
jgi:soluble lytic murein transglycosylase